LFYFVNKETDRQRLPVFKYLVGNNCRSPPCFKTLPMLRSYLRKRNFLITVLFFLAPFFTRATDTATVVISEQVLSSVYYHQVNFATPTKLVFPNLRQVTGLIYFHKNINLVGVEFPLLDSCGDIFYFHQNLALKRLNAPNLHTVSQYLYVNGNTSLIYLDVCNLQQILPGNNFAMIPYYAIVNNTPGVDQTPFCFSIGAPQNLQLLNNTVSENLPPNSVVGTLVTSNPTDSIHYFLPDGHGTDNNAFRIQGNQLFTATTFNYEVKNEYILHIGAFNQLGESTFLDTTVLVNDIASEDTVTIMITDTVLSSVHYHQVNFATPTKLVFPNLRQVTGLIYFHQNVNLVSVEFPLLDSCGDIFYFHQNLALKKLSAPNLHTVSQYLYVNGNTSLIYLDVCNLQQILPGNNFAMIPYYAIVNNTPAVDQTPFCFSIGAPQNLQLLNNTVSENLPSNSVVGTLVTSNPSDSVHYFLPDWHAADNNAFRIQGHQLLTATTFDYEVKNEYRLHIGAFNQLGESTFFDTTVVVSDMAVEDTVTIRINDTVLSTVHYHQVNFATPTKLVFPNLRQVTGLIYFHQNVNLVSVEFPLLDSCGDYFYFHQNLSLSQLNAPVLRTVTNYLYVYGHSSLELLDLCDIVRIRPGNVSEPYYLIRNNGNTDFAGSCFRTTNVIFVPASDIVIQPAPYTFIGHFIPDVDTTLNTIRYFFTDSSGAEIANADFVIRGDSIFLAREYESYPDTTFYFNVGAIRSDINVRRSAEPSGNLNEKISFKLRIGLGNVVSYRNTWKGEGISPATSAWENPANWTMEIVPDAYTDAEIISGNIIVGTNVICRSLTVRNGVNITVKPGISVTVKH